MFASDWQNPLWRLDVDDDATTSPLDALVLINRINSAVPVDFTRPIGAENYLDVDGDLTLSPLDVLSVINFLNAPTERITVELALRNDSGRFHDDSITNDSTLVGSFVRSSNVGYSAKARFNRGPIRDLVFDQGGRFVLGGSAEPIADGTIDVKVLITGPDESVGLRRLSFVLDTVGPKALGLGLVQADDTGISNSDGITKSTRPRIQVQSSAGDPVRLQLNGQILFDGVASGELIVPSPLLTDGTYNLSVESFDIAGNGGVTNRTIQVDTIPPAGGVIGLAAASDSGVLGDLITSFGRVSLQGSADPDSFVILPSISQSTRVPQSGKFLLPGVSLQTGPNYFPIDVSDLAGNSVPNSLTVVRSESQDISDPVLYWNQIALDAIRADASLPTTATRNLAMIGVAMLDSIAAIEGTPTFQVSLVPPQNTSMSVAAASAARDVLKYAYPAQSLNLDQAFANFTQPFPDGESKTNGINFGARIAAAVIISRRNDGWDRFVDYSGNESVGKWRPTAPMFDIAQQPQWGSVTPFAIKSVDALLPVPPPSLTSSQYAEAYNEVKRFGSRQSSDRTIEQTEIARFWADGAGSYTPPGHWVGIALQLAQEKSLSTNETARLIAVLNVALADAAIACWDAKFTYESWRPITAIQSGDLDSNPNTTSDSSWQPLLITPAHPEYVSGHSAFSATAAKILSAYFGEQVSFTTTSVSLPGVTRSFSSFANAAAEAGKSRIYGGIHFDFSNQAGAALGRNVADQVLSRFNVANDTQPPRTILTTPTNGGVHSINPQFTGSILDNLSGVASATFQLNQGSIQPLALNSQGEFSFTSNLLLDGTVDGAHSVTIRAKDFAGMESEPLIVSFRLDTKPPTFSVIQPAENFVASGSLKLDANVSGTGSSLVSLSYQFNSGPEIPLTIPSGESGRIERDLDVSRLAPGNHLLKLKARDAAGLQTLVTRSFTLSNPAPLTISRHTPQVGADSVGSTFRPEVHFTRPVDVLTLTPQSFYATDSSGAKLPATIVPSSDGSFAWLFFANPMPSASRITVHVNGDRIRGVDGSWLDADGDGLRGGKFSYQFTTVSLAKLPNTSIKGRVVDPGPDLKMMTNDDIKAGPDGILHTADDIFVRPITNAKVFILGHEEDAVYTDSSGFFTLTSIPTGNVKLAIDGRTATNSPNDIFFPEMVMDIDITVGIENTVMGSMGTREERQANADRTEVYLPRIQTSILKPISDTETTTVTVDPSAAPNLTEEQRSELTLDVVPGSVIGNDGKPLANAKVGISTVPPELVRDMLPPGLLQHTFDITIQAPDAATFNAPLTMTFPNVFNAEPGTKLNFLSFDHTTGRLVIEGTATVSEDGKSVATDPGSGITKPGWHGVTPPGSNGGPPCKPDILTIRNAFNVARVVANCISGLINEIKDALDQIKLAINTLNELYTIFSEVDEKYKRGEISKAEACARTQSSITLLNTLIIALGGLGEKADPIFRKVQLALDCANAVLDSLDELCKETLKKSECQTVRIVTVCEGIDIAKTSISLLSDIWTTYSTVAKNAAAQATLIGIKRLFDYLCAPPPNGSGEGESAVDPEVIKQLSEILQKILATKASSLEMQSAYTTYVSTNDQYLRIQTELNDISLSHTVIEKGWFAVLTERGVIRGKVDGLPSISFFLAPNIDFTLVVYDSVRDTIATFSSRSNASGQATLLPILDFRPFSEFIDSDGDLLVDLAETVIGTSQLNMDTDGDHLDDYVEVKQGFDPLGGRSISTGVISNVKIAGEARGIIVEGSVIQGDFQSAYVASGTFGLAILETTQLQEPVLLSEIDLHGYNFDVSIDPRSQVAVVASTEGLHFVDVSVLTEPELIRTVNDTFSAVKIVDGLAYATRGKEIRAYDVATGELVDALTPAEANIASFAVDGSFLYVSSADGVFSAVELTPTAMVKRSSIQLGIGSGNLFVGGGVGYVAQSSGYASIDVSNPREIKLISPSTTNNFSSDSFVTNGSGLGIGVGAPQGLGNLLMVVDASDPTKTNQFITQYSLAGTPNDVVLANGIAYVAAGSAGLQVVNYRSFDNQGKAPTVTASFAGVDVDPLTAGIQIVEGANARFNVQVQDDVQVRNVELLVDGKQVVNDISFPFDLSTVIPTLQANAIATTISVQVRATDTGGNQTLSDPIVLNIVPDIKPPAVVTTNPVAGQKIFYTPSIDILFDEAIDTNTLSLSGVSLLNLGSDGAVGGGDDTVWPVESIQTRNRDSRIKLIPSGILSTGKYRLVVDKSILSDRAGNSIAESVSLDFSVRPASDVIAASGMPNIRQAPSANPGQLIKLTVPGVTSTTTIPFPIRDSNGTLSTVNVSPQFIETATSSAFYRVPFEATTGNLRIPGSTDGDFPLQIVPVIRNVDVEWVSGGNGQVLLRGRGFSEGDGRYRFGTVDVVDPNTGSSTVDVFAGFEYQNDAARLTLPLSNEVFGAVTVTTQGGTSAPWTIGYSSINATAAIGTPVNPAIASANPNQSITLLGSGLTTATDIITQYRDSNGTIQWYTHRPSMAQADGSSAQITVPNSVNGNYPWGILGSATLPTLQIVPRTQSVSVNGNRSIRIDGFGYEEGTTSSYRFATTTLVDPSVDSNQVNVFYGRVADNDSVNVNLPVHGFGPLVISTAGGTNTLDMPWMTPEIDGQLYDLAFDGTSIWLLVSGKLQKIDPTDGKRLANFTFPGGISYGGLQVLQNAMSLGGVSVPAGSLLVTRHDGNVFAVSPSSGEVLASLDVAPYVYAVGGVFAPSTGNLYLLDYDANQVVVINPSNGAELARWAAGIDVNNGSLALDPSGNSLWLATDREPRVLKLSFTGTLIKQVDLAAQNVTGGINGIDFDASGNLLLSSNFNVLFKANPNFSPLKRNRNDLPSAGIDSSVSQITLEQLESSRSIAISYWAMAGLPNGYLDFLNKIPIRMTSLTNSYLGLGSRDLILLDDDAGGMGWELLCEDNSAKNNKLVTVLMHEMGHALGLEDNYEDEDSLMHFELSDDELLVPEASMVDEVLRIWSI